MTLFWCSDCYESTEVETKNLTKVSFKCGNCEVINYKYETSKQILNSGVKAGFHSHALSPLSLVMMAPLPSQYCATIHSNERG